MLPTEIHSYPDKPQITYKEGGRTFHYAIIKEGFYPNKTILKFLRKPNSFPLPDNYEVITTFHYQMESQSNTSLGNWILKQVNLYQVLP